MPQLGHRETFHHRGSASGGGLKRSFTCAAACFPPEPRCGQRVVATLPGAVSRGAREAQQLAFTHSTRGHEARAHALACWFLRGKQRPVVGRARLPQWDRMGRGSRARRRGGECYTLAVNVEMGPVFRSHSSQMPVYSLPPPFIPPSCLPFFPAPINDPFV